MSTSTASRIERTWDVLSTVLDPEVPAVSVRDLGIVRDVIEHDDGLEIVLIVLGALLLARFITWTGKRVEGRIDERVDAFEQPVFAWR